ncbi:MAG: hypothetical protein P8X85_17815 [Desulfobacterales bacterium]
MFLRRQNRMRALPVTSLLVMLLAVTMGCSASKYGKLTPDRGVQQAFQSYQILPNHKYYYRGVYSRPTVIAGISQNYAMKLKMWIPIDAESKDFRILIDRVSLQGMGNQIEPWGSIILDQEGNKVGIWYSAVRAAAVEVNKNRQIVNLSPLAQVAIGGQR